MHLKRYRNSKSSKKFQANLFLLQKANGLVANIFFLRVQLQKLHPCVVLKDWTAEFVLNWGLEFL